MLAELKTEQTEREEGGSLEQLFTEWASGLLAEKGEVEDNPANCLRGEVYGNPETA